MARASPSGHAPSSTRTSCNRWQERETGRDGELTHIEITADARQTSTATEFELTVSLTVDVDGARFFRRDWSERIPRHLV